MSNSVSNTDDIIDVRDVIVRFEELEKEIESAEDDEAKADLQEEFSALHTLLDDLKGKGGDQKWRGDWYPIVLIRDSHFTQYAEDLAEDIGAINSDAAWPLNHIDWEAAADELKGDYTVVDFDGVTYWYC